MTVTAIDYDSVSTRLRENLRRAFPHDTIETRPGYQGHVHVLVVSSLFNGKTERQKQDLFWEILRAEAPTEADAVSVAIVYGTDEL
jgi:stress-induced morphogen